jgi:hypothetical protein
MLASVASPNRQAVTGFSIFNTTASTSLTVSIYESPDTTSAAGKKIASYTLPGLSSIDVVVCIGQGYSTGQNLVAKAGSGSTGDLNAKVTWTAYTAGS